jgi:hypothetical protein
MVSGQLTRCPASLKLPESISAAMSQAYTRMESSGKEHGGVFMGEPPAITAWGPIGGGVNWVKPIESCPERFRDEVWGFYHTHPDLYSTNYPNKRALFSRGDILYSLRQKSAFDLLKGCKCTMAIVYLQRTSLLSQMKRANWIRSKDTGYRPRVLLPRIGETVKSYRRRQNKHIEDHERKLVEGRKKTGMCYYRNCGKSQTMLTLQVRKDSDK